LLLSYPEQAKTLKLLYEVSRELTSILDREELLRRVAESVRKIVDYDVFSVMLWNEQASCWRAFSPCAATIRLRRAFASLFIMASQATAAGERRVLRINDVTEDPRYIRCETGVEARSELVVPLLMQDPPHRCSRSGEHGAARVHPGTRTHAIHSWLVCGHRTRECTAL